MGLSGMRMRSNLVPTSTALMVSILKFSRIWNGGEKSRWKTPGVPAPPRRLPSPFQRQAPRVLAVGQWDAHLHEEELHLQLGDPAPQALAGSETETQPLEVLGACCQPALGAELLRLGEDLRIPAHGVETNLHQRLWGGISPTALGFPPWFC